ncbi:hypothetical protein [Roseovarius sp. MS2]|uniref:hypothetical protein n=1 Tax=Roseovarius sp. MS2 TaxID=3390728 RepID=UPI003F5C61DA
MATSVVYNRVYSNLESVTLHLNIDGTLYAMVGVRGTAAFDISASGIPYIEFEFTALYVARQTWRCPRRISPAFPIRSQPRMPTRPSSRLMRPRS